MGTVSNPAQSDGDSADLRQMAVRALRNFGAKDRGRAEELLPMWAHYGRLSYVDREVVLGVFGGPRLTTDVTCPDWCQVDHSKVYEDGLRECVSASYAVPTMVGGRYTPEKQLTVEAVRFVDLASGQVLPTQVRIGDVTVGKTDASHFADFIESVVLVIDAELDA